MENSNISLTKIPFKVSARTARLIGRENIATSKGAIIELVKNGYDADSPISIVFFDNRYSTIQNSITNEHFKELIKRGVKPEFLKNVYEKNEEEDGYNLRENVDEDILSQLKKQVSKFSHLYIIDSGEGMTQKVIREHWMTIGTDNKTTNVFTKNGRVKAGAKGIGRFALDKLGTKCELITFFNPEYHTEDVDEIGKPTSNCGYKWKVNWEDFEGEFKTIDTVNADLIGIKNSSLLEEIKKELPFHDFTKTFSDKFFQFGTILKVINLRDNWDDFYVEQVYSDLEVLVPPKETGGFEIHVFSSLYPDKYGEVYGSICDDFDYKLVAIADEKQNVRIQVFRNEYDIVGFPYFSTI